MKVALVVPGSKAGVASARYRELFPHLLPMSIAYLAAVLRKDGAEAIIIDQVPRRLSNLDLVRRLEGEKPDVVGISALTTTFSNIREIVALLRSALPDAKIVMGNHHATLFAQSILEEGFADMIVRGEGEETLRELVRCVADGKEPLAVKGISYRHESNRVVHNPDRPLIKDLDSLPYPAWDLIDIFDKRYMSLPAIGVYSTPLPVMASRGCPYNCVFCSQDKSYKKVRIRSVSSVVDEIEAMVDRHRFEWFSFNDAYFPWTRKMGFEFANELTARGLHKKIQWITETRVDMVDYELMRCLKESGLAVAFFGFESGNQRVLDMTGKGTTLAQAEEAARACRKAGVTSVGFFMLGLPGDSAKSCWDTVDFAIKLDCDFAKFALTIPYPGSKLFDDVKGAIPVDQFEKFNSWYTWASGDEEILYAPEGMTRRELLAIQRGGMLKFYARPTQILRHLRRGSIRPRDMAYGAYVLIEGLAKSLF